VCDWFADNNCHKFPSLASYRAHVTAAHAPGASSTALSMRVHDANGSGTAHIQLSNAISVTANLVSSSLTPIVAEAAHGSHPSTATSPGVRSYTGSYTATPQSARAISYKAPALSSSSSLDRIESHNATEHDLIQDPPAASSKGAVSAASDAHDTAQPKQPDSLPAHSQHAGAALHNTGLIASAPASVPAVSQREHHPVSFSWKSIALQEQGEAALAQLKVENESLHRQLQLQREEAAAQKARSDLQLEQMRQQAVLQAAVSCSRIGGLEAQITSSAAALESRLRRELSSLSCNLSDHMQLVKELGGSAVQREFDGAGLEDVVVALKQQQLQLQAQVSMLQRSLAADSAALAVAEASVEAERKRVRDLETKVAAAMSLPTAALNVAKLINAVVVEHPGGGALSVRERRLVSIIEAMELEITEMHVASDALVEALNTDRIKNSSKAKTALEGYEEQRELLAMADKLKHAERRELYLAAQVSELTRMLDSERTGAPLQQIMSHQESNHTPDAATPFGWLSQAPGPGEHERLSRNSAVVNALETAISCIPDAQAEMSSLKSQLKVALQSFWQMEVESLLLRRRLFQTSALIEAGADRLHAREKLLSQELTSSRDRHDDTVKQLQDTHLNQCLQLSKQAALFQVQCEIKDIIAQELKMERDTAFADLQNAQAAVFSSNMSAFKTMHARLVAISQEAARLANVCRFSLWRM
jgi:hypothetical protein